MGDSDDFTFCQVSTSVGNNSSLSSNFPNIKNISLNDDSETGKKSTSLFKYDTSLTNLQQKGFGSRASPSADINKSPPKLEKSVAQNIEMETQQLSNVTVKQQQTTMKKFTPRAKVPFEIGCSPMDWLKLTRSGQDLAGLNGQSNRRLISMDEVKKHRKEGPIWTVLKGRVYHISPYMKFHPGGEDMLMKAAGRDCTSLFNKYHAWVNAEFLLEKCLVGILDDSA